MVQTNPGKSVSNQKLYPCCHGIGSGFTRFFTFFCLSYAGTLCTVLPYSLIESIVPINTGSEVSVSTMQ